MADEACAGCGKPMGYGEYEVAEGKEYHTECFVCCFCQKKFENGVYSIEGGRPCHAKCADDCLKPDRQTENTKAQEERDTCAECEKTIPPGVEMLTMKDPKDARVILRRYHVACFKCTDCGKPIGQKKYALTHGQAVHLECMHGAQQTTGKAEEFTEGLKCTHCGELIRGQKKEVPDFGAFHLTCFKCVKCGLGITKEFYKDDATGKARCHRCPP